MSKVTLMLPNQAESTVLDCRIEGNAFFISLEDTVYEGSLVLTGPGEGWVNYASHILPFYMTQKQDMLNLWLDGKTYHIGLINPEARCSGGGAAVASGDVKSPMPGTILKVLTQAGEAVEANQPLVIMESMKMEMTLSAPQAATIKQVHCEAGQLVDMGALLVAFEVE